MKDKKLQVFVSSTFTDLKEERQAAVEAILSSGHIPAGMELFSAGDESQMSVIKRWIDESDIYLLILGGRYGSVEPNSGKSYTHLEYEYAVELKKPLFAVVINENALDAKIKENGKSVIEQDNPQLLKEFKASVLSNLVKFWDDTKDIKLAIYETISEFSYRKDLIGWIRGDNNINTGVLAEEMAKLTKENSELRLQISQRNNTDLALYSNLTYEQLEGLLKSEDISISIDEKINLLEYLLDQGQTFAEGAYFRNKSIQKFEKLILFKVVQKQTVLGVSLPTEHFIRFTEDGHKFYLKALYLSRLN